MGIIEQAWQSTNSANALVKATKEDQAKQKQSVRFIPDTLDKAGFKLELLHVPTGIVVDFSGFVTNFVDNYTSQWNSEEVFGRMDPIQSFQGTTRKITIEWEVPSDSLEHAKVNFQKATRLFRMLYPVYDSVPGMSGNVSSATSISSAPLFKMKFANLIADAASPGGSVKDSGLVGSIAGFNYSPDFEAGFFSDGDGFLYPQTIVLAAEFTVTHTHSLGWRKGEAEDFSKIHFPYAAKNQGTEDLSVSKPSGGAFGFMQDKLSEISAKTIGG